ncbi:hypothetical protein OA101_00020 [Alphaproteobacteria bacterium]|nr:hypothetical protein [Alphaproteobacteria bacterium]
MDQLTEFQVWSMFGPMSIAFALRSIGTILLVWLALRIATNIRESGENNIVAKILGTAFGGITVAFAYYWQTAYISYRANIANGLVDMQSNGVEISAGATQFVTNFASGTMVTTPAPIIIAFDLIVLAMILGSIWMPKKS